MKGMLSIAMMVAICAFGVACGNESTPASSEEAEIVQLPVFEDIVWRLVEYRGESGEMTSVLERTAVDAEFRGGEVGGTAGCNRYFGSYTLEEESRMTFGSEMGSTQKMCPPEVMEQEERYLALLGQVAAVSRVGDHLHLQDAESTVLLDFVATEPASLENTQWQATGINNGKGGVVSSASTSQSTAIFVEGQLSGTGGCNRFTAPYEIDGDRITIGPAASTRKLCNEPEGIMDQEQQFFAALGRAHTFNLTPEKLELRDEKGSLQVSFRVTEE